MAEIIWDSELGPSWPDDWEHTTVHAQFVAVTGDGADTDRLPDIAPSGNGEVIFTPSLRTVRYVGADGPYVVSLKQYRAVVDSEGYLCTPDTFGQPGERGIVLPSTDAPVIEPRGEDDNAFTWRVDFDIPAVNIRSDHIAVPVGGPYNLVDLLSPERAAGVVHIIDRVSARDAIQAAQEATAARDLVLPARDQTLAARDQAVAASDALTNLETNVDDLKYKKTIPTNVTADEMRHRDYTGEYRVLSSQAGTLGLPDPTHGILSVIHMSGPDDLGQVFQIWTTRSRNTWARYILAGPDRAWNDWAKDTSALESIIDEHSDEISRLGQEVDRVSVITRPLSGNENLDTDFLNLENSGYYSVPYMSRAANLGLPNPVAGILEIRNMSGRDEYAQVYQEWRPHDGPVYFRHLPENPSSEWSPWTLRTGPSSDPSASNIGGQARTRIEMVGEYSTYEDELEYLEALSHHQAVTVFDVGTSVEGRTISAIRIGDPALPTVLYINGQHGDEPGGREGAYIFARDMANSKTMIPMDVCILIVPTMNPDRMGEHRRNANNVDLNRDWSNFNEPETQAVASLFTQYNVVAVVDIHNGSPRNRPREIGIREPQGDMILPEVQDRALMLYHGMMDRFEGSTYQYGRYDAGAPLLDNPDFAINGIAINFEVPTLLVEMPNPNSTSFPDFYAIPPYWQAEAARFCHEETLTTVWENLDAFTA